MALRRIRLGTTFDELTILFQVSDRQYLIDMFWEISVILYENSNEIPKIWLENLADSEKDKFFESYFNRLDPLYQKICDNVQGRKHL